MRTQTRPLTNGFEQLINYGAPINKGGLDASIILALSDYKNTRSLSVRDTNFCDLFYQCGHELKDPLEPDPMLLDPKTSDFLKELAVYGACYEVACISAEAFQYQGRESTLWVGFVDFCDDGKYSGSHLHAFLTTEDDKSGYMFDPISVRRLSEHGEAPSHYCGVPIPFQLITEWWKVNQSQGGLYMWFAHLFNEILASTEKTQELIRVIQNEYGPGMFPKHTPTL